VSWAPWLTLPWLAALVSHGVYVFALADYGTPRVDPTSPGDS
jgi:hypothetical protein